MANYNIVLNLNSIIVPRVLLLCNNVTCTTYQHKHAVDNCEYQLLMFLFLPTLIAFI